MRILENELQIITRKIVTQITEYMINESSY